MKVMFLLSRVMTQIVLIMTSSISINTLLIDLTDYIDIRPRVSSYTLTGATRSPFEFDGRSFTTGGQSAPHILSDDETLTLTFDYYLPRIDRLFLTTNGSFQIQLEHLQKNLFHHKQLMDLLILGRCLSPAYTYEADQVKTLLKAYKRYRMSDIGRIDQRVKNLEYYTKSFDA